MTSRSDLLFQQWSSSLASRDRSRAAIDGNFEEIFKALKAEGLTLEAAYEYLPKAIKAHSPSAAVLKNTFKKLKTSGAMQTSEKEFTDSWLKNIADKAEAIFFECFPVEVKTEEPEGPPVYGNMTAKEYKAQRSHADQYPRLDTEELERRLQTNTYDPMQDLGALLGSTRGDTK